MKVGIGLSRWNASEAIENRIFRLLPKSVPVFGEMVNLLESLTALLSAGSHR